VERSIYEAYLSTIRHAQHYIYIENQYFISSTGGSGIQNQIAQALVDRIARAWKENAKFRVIVVLPVHPEGNLADEYSLVYIMKWQYFSINRGGNSLMEQVGWCDVFFWLVCLCVCVCVCVCVCIRKWCGCCCFCGESSPLLFMSEVGKRVTLACCSSRV
jgi:hypothetical protein